MSDAELELGGLALDYIASDEDPGPDGPPKSRLGLLLWTTLRYGGTMSGYLRASMDGARAARASRRKEQP